MSPEPAAHHRVVACALALACTFACVLNAHAFFEESFEQRYFFEPGRLVTDHTIMNVPGDGFHIFYTVGDGSWMLPGNMVDFGHATSEDLIHWTIQPRVLSIVEGTWKDGNLFAPHVIRNQPDGYLMYYTGLDEAAAQATGVAVSTDLYEWEDLSIDAAAYHPDPAWAIWEQGMPSNGRDPFAFRLAGGIALLSTATASAEYTGSSPKGAISFAQSNDGLNFVDIGDPFFLNTNINVLESCSLYRRPNTWFMFYHEGNVAGIHYMTSESLFGEWDKTQAKDLDPFALGPAEIFSWNDATMFSRVIDADFDGSQVFGAKVDSVRFGADTVAYGIENTLDERWHVIEGNAFEHSPTFGDRPLRRGEVGSGIKGAFYINSGETYDGPLGIEDYDAPPDYSATGSLRSDPFDLTGEHINLWVGGGQDPAQLYVALKDASDGSTLFTATGSGSNEMFRRLWDTSALVGLTAYFEIVDQSTSFPLGYISVDDIREGLGTGVGVDDSGVPAPARLQLGSPFPNPVMSAAQIPLSLDEQSRVRLSVFDVQGRMRRLVSDGRLEPGDHQLKWDGRDMMGSQVESGIYFLRLDASGTVTTRKIVVDR